ncbi:cell wall-binding repeat-containing protein [Methanococcus aeolicus]|uniref:cell wall-binding repeat-containing protein n=1 Tax=Methanococcus aeolicus TaxID=42879 RepID=UPI0021C8ADF0|nr:cell wall-binding repeat-containing protein [Methanococcus aeolicus]UXM85410.1 hypothetical protein N6C89_03795 [Methanococcus aeolicus]
MKIHAILLSLLIVFGAIPLSLASTTDNIAIIVSTPADAVIAAPYARAMGYELIYTPTNELSEDAKRKLTNIDKAIIVGGPIAVSESVENSLKSLNLKTERIAGETRVETSQKMFDRIKQDKPEMVKNVIVVEGFNEKIIPVAVSYGAPILYTGLNKDNQIIETMEKSIKPETVVLLGNIPSAVQKVAQNRASNIMIASGNDETVIKNALSYVSKINPNAENKAVAVVYAEKTNNPILDAVVSFGNGFVGAIAPISVPKEDIVDKIISKLTFASEVSISSDSPSISNVISNVANKFGLSATTIKTTPSSGGGGAPSAAEEDNKPTINKFDVSTNGLDVSYTINVSDDNGLKKIVLKYGDGTEREINISGKSYATTISKNYLMQTVYTATITAYDNNNQKSTPSTKEVNLKYFNIDPASISKRINGAVNEVIPITITNHQNTSISITNTTTGTSANLAVSMSGNLTIPANTAKTINYNITNISALPDGKSYQAKVVFALNGYPKINKTFVLDITVPKQETITTTGNSSVSLQVVNTTVAENTSITIDDNATNNAFVINTTVGAKSLDITIPTTNTTNTTTIVNTTIHLENIKDAFNRAEEIQNTSTLTEALIKPVVVASKAVDNVSVDIKNITFDETTNKSTINTEIKFNNTNDTFVVVAIPIGNNSVSGISKNNMAIPEYDGTGNQTKYYKYDATNGILILFMKEDPVISITVTVKAINEPPTISYTYIEDGLNILINASKSSDPEGAPLTFTWLAPGNQSVSYLDGGKTINITYPADGTYNTTLTISDGVYDVSSVITVSVAQPVAEKPAIKVVANSNSKFIEFVGQNSNTITIDTTKNITIPTITATVNVVDKKTNAVEIYFKDNVSVKSIIEAMNNYNKVAYNGDTITITYNNADMNGKNVSLNIITTRKTFRNDMNELLGGDATGLIDTLHMSHISTETVSSGKATFTISADDSNADHVVVITEGNMVMPTNNEVKILAVGGFEVMKYNMTLTFVGTNPITNDSIYNISINDTPSNNIRYGLAMIDKNTGVTINVVGTNPNNNLFNISVVGNSGSEIIVENNDFITLNASKINDIVGTIFTPDTASATYSSSTTNSTVTLKLQNVSNAHVIGIAYDTVDKKIVAVEQQ